MQDEQGRRKRGSSYRRSAADNLQGHAGPGHAAAYAERFGQPKQCVLAELGTVLDHLARLPASQRLVAEQEVLALLQERGLLAHARNPTPSSAAPGTCLIAQHQLQNRPQQYPKAQLQANLLTRQSWRSCQVVTKYLVVAGRDYSSAAKQASWLKEGCGDTLRCIEQARVWEYGGCSS